MGSKAMLLRGGRLSNLSSAWIFILFALFLGVFPPSADAWHDMTNVNYHCWPLSANAYNPLSFASCPGVNIRWILPPPLEIKADEHFNVTYELTLDAATFYPWAVDDAPFDNLKANFFDQANTVGITDPTAAQSWCESVVCPGTVAAANTENCCVHHVNVHSCPLNQGAEVKNGLCGPWIPATGDIFTHSQVLYGSILRGNWTSVVPGLHATGETSMIAHFKLVKMHIALEASVNVLPRAICGDGKCEEDEGESCSICPADCGRCPLKAWELGAIGGAVTLILGAFLSVVGYFKWQQEKLFWDESWVIPYDEIKPDNKAHGFMGSAISVQSGNSQGGGMAQSAARRQVFTQTAFFDGRTVAIKKIKKIEFQLDKAIRREVKAVRELDHPNLCRFIGGCIEVPEVAIVTEYCPKGSLNDVLMNEDVPLNWGFRFSFATDVARACSYIHSHKIYHGHLKSSNCLIDDRWTIKLADHGLNQYRYNEAEDEEDFEEENTKRLNSIYKAPELLDDPFAVPTAAADVYSYAIVLVEIATREEPYGEEDLMSLPEGWRPPLPAHEVLEGDEYSCPCPKEYNNLIEDCWETDPLRRMTFDNARKAIHRINPDKMSPVDLMMAMMEKYSKHLEVIVGERTADLAQEKEKTDRLLYSMIPQSVAEELKLGKTIPAVEFDACTIYFSDIVGFTAISGGSTPFEVVALLNKLYTCFDSIIDSYDVYKVETIGDAYMVVSGVPRMNGDNHAREVTNMSIDIVVACEVFVIPHRPGELLKIRVGLHSGSVCAGVVGLKMPRYCLFGDTVNTASRMESNGEAYKIHISEYTEALLMKFPGFRVERRGTIPVKGKGEMTTYWVKGRTEENPLGPIHCGEGLEGLVKS